jgi:hypothetical protein
MTIKEIAELCGVKSEQTVKNWAHKIGDDPARNWQGIVHKLVEAEKSGKEAADFTLEETLAIIGEGGKNKTLAALLAENAANKDKLTVVDRRYTGLQEDIERIIDNKIQDSMQQIGQKLDEMRKLIALPTPAEDTSLQKIIAFVKSHVIFTGNEDHLVKQCNVWALYKYTTDNPGKMDAFITRFCMIYGQDREFKYKNIRAFSGFYLKDTKGVCGEGWD